MSHFWHVVEVVAVIAALGGIAVGGGAWLVRGSFHLVDRRARRTPPALPADDGASAVATGKHGEAVAAATTENSVVAAGAQLRGGVWIGMLERLSIYAGLVAHYPEAIAIVLAVKGLARYPELQATNTAAAERFIIGTFVSVLCACGMAGLALWLVGSVL